jgi:GNAT superfamily N-acetyltransferase
MEIRDAGRKDISSLTRIIRDSFRDVAERFSLTPENCPTHPSFISEERVESAFEKGNRFFLAECEEGLCGCVAVEVASPEICYLERLAVLPPYRRRGYGKKLVEQIMRQAREAGARSLEIGIIADQEDLRDWYAKLGFTAKGRKIFDHLPFEVLFMAYQL